MFRFTLPRGLVQALQRVGLIPDSPERNIQYDRKLLVPITIIAIPPPVAVATTPLPVAVATPVVGPTVDFVLTPKPFTYGFWTVTTTSTYTLFDPHVNTLNIPSITESIIPIIYTIPTNITLISETCVLTTTGSSIGLAKLLGLVEDGVVSGPNTTPNTTINYIPTLLPLPTGMLSSYLLVGIDITYTTSFANENEFRDLLNKALQYLALSDDELAKLQQICVCYNYAMLKIINSIVKSDYTTLVAFQENIDISAVKCYFYYKVGDVIHATTQLDSLQMSCIMYYCNKAVDTKPKTRGVGPLIRRISATGTPTVQSCQGMSPGIVDTVARIDQITMPKSNKYFLALTCTKKNHCQLFFDIMMFFYYLIDKIAGGKHLYEFRTGSPLTQWYTGCNLGAQLGIGLGDLVEMLDIAKGNTRIYTSQTGTYAEMMRSRIVAAIVLTLGGNINNPVDIANVTPLVKLFTFKIYGNTPQKRKNSINNFLDIVKILFQKSIDKINSKGNNCGESILLRTIFRFQPYTGWAHSLVIVCDATFTPPVGGYVINNIYFLETYFCSTSTTIPCISNGGSASENDKNYPMPTFNYWLFNSKSDKPPYDTMKPSGLYYICDDIITPFIQFSEEGFIEILRLQSKDINDFISAANSLTAQLVLIDENLLDRLFDVTNNCCGSIYPGEIIQMHHSGRPSLHRTATILTHTDGSVKVKTPGPSATSSCITIGGNDKRKREGDDDDDDDDDDDYDYDDHDDDDDYDYDDKSLNKSLTKIICLYNNNDNINIDIGLYNEGKMGKSITHIKRLSNNYVVKSPKSTMPLIGSTESSTRASSLQMDVNPNEAPNSFTLFNYTPMPSSKSTESTPFNGFTNYTPMPSSRSPESSTADDDDFDLGGGKRRKRSHKKRKSTRRRRTHNKRKSVKKRHSHKKRKHNKRRTRR